MTESESYEERHARASSTFQVFVPGVEPDRVAASFGKRLGALGGFAFDVVGEMWGRPVLSRRDRSLIVVSTLAAQARDEELELHTEIAIRNGLTRVEVEEIVLTVAGYAGFPAAMAAARRVDAGLRTAESVDRLSDRSPAVVKSDAQRDEDAAVVYGRMAGQPAAGPGEALAQLEARLGGVGLLIYRWGFGEIWARTQLSPRDRSLSVIAILVALGAQAQLSFHVPAGMRNGLSREEIEAAITHLSLYSGFPRAVDAIQTARAAFATLDQ